MTIGSTLRIHIKKENIFLLNVSFSFNDFNKFHKVITKLKLLQIKFEQNRNSYFELISKISLSFFK